MTCFRAFSVVFCVRFSADGKYLATGSNQMAQIYDMKTGTKTWFGFLGTCWLMGPLTQTVITAQRLDRQNY